MIRKRNTRLNTLTSATLPLALAALATTVLSSGCTVDAGDSLFILHNKPLTTECQVSAEKGGTFLSRGLVDIRIGTGYTFTPVVESRARIVDDTDPLERAILIGGAEVSIELPEGVTAGGDLLTSTQRFSGTIEPGGLSGFMFDIISPQLVAVAGNALVGQTALVDITMFGELGNGTVESPQFTYPVQFCDGCSVQSCNGYQMPEGRSCIPGQDFYEANCCAAEDGELICPPPPPPDDGGQQ